MKFISLFKNDHHAFYLYNLLSILSGDIVDCLYKMICCYEGNKKIVFISFVTLKVQVENGYIKRNGNFDNL